MAVNKSSWGDDEHVDANAVEEEQQKEKKNEEAEVEKQQAPSAEKPVEAPSAVMNIQIPSKEEGMKLFSRLDPNGNGLLSLAELDKGVLELFPEFNNKPAIMRAYKAADRSGDGFVTRNEFGYFLRYLQYYNNLWSLFVAVDTSGDRRITPDELEKAAGILDLPKDPSTVFTEIDENGGGFILFEELCHWMAVNKSSWGDDEHVDANAVEEEQQKEKKNEEAEVAKTGQTVADAEPIPAEAIGFELPPKEEVMQLLDSKDTMIADQYSHPRTS